MLDEVVADIASVACAPGDGAGSDPRSLYQRGRADWAGGRVAAAKREFEQALAGGYRAAGIDLAMLLTLRSSVTPDLPRAIALYEQAWRDGTIGEGEGRKLVGQIGVAVAGRETNGRKGEQDAAEYLGAEGLDKETSILQR